VVLHRKWKPEWGTPKFLLVSVPHTGTNFTLYMLRKGLGQPQDISRILCYGHLDRHKMEMLLEFARVAPTVVPLRHPAAVVRSWGWRYVNRPELYEELPGYYQRLVEDIDPLDPYYLPIDVEDRQVWLDKLSAGFGLPLVTQWKPVNRGKDKSEVYEDTQKDREVLKYLETEYAEFFSRFYDL